MNDATVAVDARVVKSVRATTRSRRLAALAVFAGGFMSLVSALTPSIESRMRIVADWMPLAAHQAVFALTAVIGVALILLSGGVRRGQFRAWVATVVLLIASAVGHLLKDLDVEESVVSLALAAWLVTIRRRFRAPSSLARDEWRGRLAAVVAVVGALLVSAVSLTLRRSELSLPKAIHAIIDRLANDRSIPIGGRLDSVLSAALAGVGAMIALLTIWTLLRPSRTSAERATAVEARQLVAGYGCDTLSYFALRHDKDHWVFDRTLVSYAVFNGTCLVSPDPIGPADEAIDAWASFAQFVSDQGWSLAVLGASERWCPVYTAFGMRTMYIGDEAIVDVRSFALAGNQMKGLRQASNRLANHGYTISFYDPSTINAELTGELRSLMAESRRGAVERGFSMTLSRVFDPEDAGLLLAVCHGPDGLPAAFCQFVPAGDRAYSLDLMRRSTAEHPNGLTDFVLVRTIEHLRDDTLCESLSLNFATMRAVLAGERGGVGSSVQRSVLTRMSDSMQIESLWRYTAKFRPRWQPRFLAYDSSEHLASIGVAVARAESFWELPVVGGLFTPAATSGAPLCG